mmetsp:Transcript_16868/g.55189  ORF Transcript_16868/g.55189 Transcript_16868/m.55189 type:complete len:251 (-) Transcript_16868:521-1273(-)
MPYARAELVGELKVAHKLVDEVEVVPEVILARGEGVDEGGDVTENGGVHKAPEEQDEKGEELLLLRLWPRSVAQERQQSRVHRVNVHPQPAVVKVGLLAARQAVLPARGEPVAHTILRARHPVHQEGDHPHDAGDAPEPCVGGVLKVLEDAPETQKPWELEHVAQVTRARRHVVEWDGCERVKPEPSAEVVHDDPRALRHQPTVVVVVRREKVEHEIDVKVNVDEKLKPKLHPIRRLTVRHSVRREEREV